MYRCVPIIDRLHWYRQPCSRVVQGDVFDRADKCGEAFRQSQCFAFWPRNVSSNLRLTEMMFPGRKVGSRTPGAFWVVSWKKLYHKDFFEDQAIRVSLFTLLRHRNERPAGSPRRASCLVIWTKGWVVGWQVGYRVYVNVADEISRKTEERETSPEVNA